MNSTSVGPAGWSYQDWKGVVYPKHKPRGFHETTYLAQYFDTIEINSSFYHPLQLDHCLQWLDQIAVNPRFLFTAKLWQRFTHERGGSVVDEHAVRVGFDVLFEAERLGAVLLQFPFSFHNTKDNFVYLKKLLKRFAEYPLVVEVRHASWNNELFYEALRERKVGFCNDEQLQVSFSRSLKQPHNGHHSGVPCRSKIALTLIACSVASDNILRRA